MKPRRWLTLRARLTLWYAVALAATLTLFSTWAYVLLEDALAANIEQQLRRDLAAVAAEPARLREPARLSAALADPERWRLELWAHGRVVLALPDDDARRLGPPSSCDPAIRFARTTSSRGVSLRVACQTIDHAGTTYIARAARSTTRDETELRWLASLLVVALPVAVAVSCLVGYGLAWWLLRPVKRMAEQASQISAARLAERLVIDNPRDELGQLASSFNHTFARLERSFEQMRRFSADASHELRTPLAAIRTMGEVALASPRDAEGYREVISSVLEETDALRSLVDNLLTLARADAGQLAIARAPVELAQLAQGVAAHLEVLAEDKQQVVSITAPEPVVVCGDAALLRHAIINLLDNAIKYSPAGSCIELRVARAHGDAIVEVRDQGPGIAAEHRDKIFERFYRIDPARARQHGASGLGLAIARWVVEANGGTLGVDSDGRTGSVFQIRLPASDPGAA